MFHYIWRLSENDGTTGPEIKTKSPVYKAFFPHDGIYQLRVVAVDRYGNWSDPKDIDFKVALTKPNSFWDTLAAASPIIVATLTSLFALSFMALLFLAHRSPRAFTMLSDPAWGPRLLTWPFFFLRHVPRVQRWVMEPYFQAVRRTIADVPFLDPPVSTTFGSKLESKALLQRLRV
jgi:hypothetical protein